jgi:hypothetical protein
MAAFDHQKQIGEHNYHNTPQAWRSYWSIAEICGNMVNHSQNPCYQKDPFGMEITEMSWDEMLWRDRQSFLIGASAREKKEAGTDPC